MNTFFICDCFSVSLYDANAFPRPVMMLEACKCRCPVSGLSASKQSIHDSVTDLEAVNFEIRHECVGRLVGTIADELPLAVKYKGFGVICI